MGRVTVINLLHSKKKSLRNPLPGEPVGDAGLAALAGDEAGDADLCELAAGLSEV